MELHRDNSLVLSAVHMGLHARPAINIGPFESEPERIGPRGTVI